MPGVGDFVRGTLTYVANCFLALLTLIWAAITFRPVTGAIRCKVRYDWDKTEVPDSRVMLFLGSCVFGVLLSFALQGTLATLTEIAKLAAGATDLPKGALVSAVLTYFICEWSIVRSTSRRLMPGRKGRRNRQILRYLVACLLIQVAIYEPIAFTLLGLLPKSMTTEAANPNPFEAMRDFTMMIVKIGVILTPFLYLYAALDKSKSLRSGDADALGRLPVNLIMAAIGAELLVGVLYPPVTPKFIALQCRALPQEGKKHYRDVLVTAQYVNDGDAYWTPKGSPRLTILGPKGDGASIDRSDDYVAEAYGWAPTGPGGLTRWPIIVPHSRGVIKQRAEVGTETLGRTDINRCSLSDHDPRSRSVVFLFLTDRRSDELFDWNEIKPSETAIGDLSVENLGNAQP
jgi:hypothetical protein